MPAALFSVAILSAPQTFGAAYTLTPGGFRDWEFSSTGSVYMRETADNNLVFLDYPFAPITNPFIATAPPTENAEWSVGGMVTHGTRTGRIFKGPDGQEYEWGVFGGAPLVRTWTTEAFVAAGTVLSGSGRFGTLDAPQYPDAMSVSIGTDDVLHLAIKDVPVRPGGEVEWTDWVDWTWTAPQSGTYRLELTMVEDFDVRSYGDFGKITVTLPSTVPDEPSALSLFGFGLLACALGFRRSERGREQRSTVTGKRIFTKALAVGVSMAAVVLPRSEAQSAFDAASDFSGTAAAQNSTRATATATVVNGFVVSIIVVNGGNGYTTAPKVTISGGGGTGASATATVKNGAVVQVTVDAAGKQYTSTPQVLVEPPSTDLPLLEPRWRTTIRIRPEIQATKRDASGGGSGNFFNRDLMLLRTSWRSREGIVVSGIFVVLDLVSGREIAQWALPSGLDLGNGYYVSQFADADKTTGVWFTRTGAVTMAGAKRFPDDPQQTSFIWWKFTPEGTANLEKFLVGPPKWPEYRESDLVNDGTIMTWTQDPGAGVYTVARYDLFPNVVVGIESANSPDGPWTRVSTTAQPVHEPMKFYKTLVGSGKQ